jgi:hypothetical protein
MNSEQDFSYPARHLVIYAEVQPPEASARRVARHFGFPLLGETQGDLG